MTSFARFMLTGIIMNALETRVLAKMNAGLFLVDPKLRMVKYFHVRRRRWYPKKIQYHSRTGRARINFNGGGCIYMNRLVFIWMQREIPAEVIDHKDGDRTNDSPNNLEPQTWDESNRQGGLKSAAQRRYEATADDIPLWEVKVMNGNLVESDDETTAGPGEEAGERFDASAGSEDCDVYEQLPIQEVPAVTDNGGHDFIEDRCFACMDHFDFYVKTRLPCFANQDFARAFWRVVAGCDVSKSPGLTPAKVKAAKPKRQPKGESSLF